MTRVWTKPDKFISTTIDWSDLLLKLRMPQKRPGCDWITFESIQYCLDNNILEDTTIPQDYLKSNHAARIAHLVTILNRGEKLDPIHLNAGNRYVSIWDGSHRFRAYQFVRNTKNIPIMVTGPYAECLHFVTSSVQEQYEILAKKQSRELHRVKFGCVCGSQLFEKHKPRKKYDPKKKRKS